MMYDTQFNSGLKCLQKSTLKMGKERTKGLSLSSLHQAFPRDS